MDRKLPKASQSWRIPDELWAKVKPLLPPRKWPPLGCHRAQFMVRDCFSEEILLARPLLSSSQGDLTTFLTEVKAQLERQGAGQRGHL